jgi:hypothetical protein
LINDIQRPATTTAKRLAKLDDVAFVGGSFISSYFFVQSCSIKESQSDFYNYSKIIKPYL